MHRRLLVIGGRKFGQWSVCNGEVQRFAKVLLKWSDWNVVC